MPIAEISAKIPDLSKVTITFYGWLSMQDIKNKVMQSILDKHGVNTDSRGMCISLPIDDMVGIE